MLISGTTLLGGITERRYYACPRLRINKGCNFIEPNYAVFKAFCLRSRHHYKMVNIINFIEKGNPT